MARGFVVKERAVEVDAREAKHDAHLLLAIQPKHLRKPIKGLPRRRQAHRANPPSSDTREAIYRATNATLAVRFTLGAVHLALLADQPRAAIGRRRVAVVEPLDRQVHREEAGDLAVRAHARNVPQLRVHVGDGFEQLDWHSAVTIDSI